MHSGDQCDSNTVDTVDNDGARAPVGRLLHRLPFAPTPTLYECLYNCMLRCTERSIRNLYVLLCMYRITTVPRNGYHPETYGITPPDARWFLHPQMLANLLAESAQIADTGQPLQSRCVSDDSPRSSCLTKGLHRVFWNIVISSWAPDSKTIMPKVLTSR